MGVEISGKFMVPSSVSVKDPARVPPRAAAKRAHRHQPIAPCVVGRSWQTLRASLHRAHVRARAARPRRARSSTRARVPGRRSCRQAAQPPHTSQRARAARAWTAACTQRRTLGAEHVADGVGDAGRLVIDDELKALCADQLDGVPRRRRHGGRCFAATAAIRCTLRPARCALARRKRHSALRLFSAGVAVARVVRAPRVPLWCRGHGRRRRCLGVRCWPPGDGTRGAQTLTAAKAASVHCKSATHRSARAPSHLKFRASRNNYKVSFARPALIALQRDHGLVKQERAA